MVATDLDPGPNPLDRQLRALQPNKVQYKVVAVSSQAFYPVGEGFRGQCRFKSKIHTEPGQVADASQHDLARPDIVIRRMLPIELEGYEVSIHVLVHLQKLEEELAGAGRFARAVGSGDDNDLGLHG